MGKKIFVLGILVSAIAGVVLSNRLVRREYVGSNVLTSMTHTCPTVWINFNPAPESLPSELTSCVCPAQATAAPEGGVPIHPPEEIVAALHPVDQLQITYTEFVSPINDKKTYGLSFSLLKGANSQTWVISPAQPVYIAFATLVAAPFLIGTALVFIIAFLPKRKAATDSFT